MAGIISYFLTIINKNKQKNVTEIKIGALPLFYFDISMLVPNLRTTSKCLKKNGYDLTLNTETLYTPEMYIQYLLRL